MPITKYNCDECGAECDYSKVKIVRIELTNRETNLPPLMKHQFVCTDCYNKRKEAEKM
ncbi:MAG: hypothetical protein K6T16_01530 [Candidatus Pacearchaeota archaeon]|nr:hypothetical protein [Candidatus Pacearchaeota archaeon]